MFFDRILAFDHVRQTLHLIQLARIGEDVSEAALRKLHGEATARLDELEGMLSAESPATTPVIRLDPPSPAESSGPPEEAFEPHFDSPFPKNRFMEAVDRIREHIYEGDAFQVVLSRRLDTIYTGDPFHLYRALRQVNPSPYLVYLDLPGDRYLIGSSPEILVQVQQGMARVYPIAGTRPRGATPEEDRAMEEDLRADPKELAEHTMLIDLGRNDLARVCVPGSVKVVRQMQIERFSHVMHIVSEVEGRLADGMTPMKALTASFPAGTVSGAPKVRAMQIIERLEPVRRGPYAGAAGYFDYSGNMDTCIVIRTFVLDGDRLSIQAGAGIVADSVPEREFEETLHKSRALVRALALARRMQAMQAEAGVEGGRA
jgi:anthranilate synthase component 1